MPGLAFVPGSRWHVPYGVPWAAKVRFAAAASFSRFAVAYVALFAARAWATAGSTDRAVQRLFAVPNVTAGWLHYLAFDLSSAPGSPSAPVALRIPHVLIVPVLLLTFLFGPAGLLAFALVRGVWRMRRPTALPAIDPVQPLRSN